MKAPIVTASTDQELHRGYRQDTHAGAIGAHIPGFFHVISSRDSHFSSHFLATAFARRWFSSLSNLNPPRKREGTPVSMHIAACPSQAMRLLLVFDKK
jgi:hypothetical protein